MSNSVQQTNVDSVSFARLRTFILVAALAAAWSAVAGEPVGPTVKEVMEFTRIIQPLEHDDDTLRTQTSPDGEHAFIVTRRADVATDKNRFEILLLEVGRQLVAARPREPVSLFSMEAREDRYDGDPPLREARWVDSRTIVFRARMHDQPFQVYRLDVSSRRLAQLTYEPIGVVSFDVSGDLGRVVYVAPVANPPIEPGARTGVVGANSFWSIHGPNSLETQLRRYRYVVAEAGVPKSARQLGEAFGEGSSGLGASSVSISPDGRWALLPRFDPTRQIVWGRQYPRIGELTAKFGPSMATDPLGYFSRPQAYVPRRLVAYRLADGREQTVLDAPDDSTQMNQRRSDRLWQGAGRSVVIAGTYLPQPHDASGGTASRIIEYWPDSGKWQEIALLRNQLKEAFAVDAGTGAFVAVDGEERRRFERSSKGEWQEVQELPKARSDRVGPRPAWRLHVEQSLNQPPDIVAIGPAGDSTRLTRLNPQYSAETWGTMRRFDWKDGKGRRWQGGLMAPANFDPKVRHALVIQTYGFSENRFYRDGPNTYDGFTSGFAGRAFLRENILVLAMPTRAATDEPVDLHERAQSFNEGIRGAIDSLVSQGTVDRDRIGIIGWSMTGGQVLDLVTFTDTPIRAASMVDGDSNTLFSMTITYAVLDGIQQKKERLNQGGPFGETLGRWIRNDPSLHTDCVRAALRFEAYGSHVGNNWDVYALLRRQYRPVEMVVFPRGAHALSRPSERMVSLQGNLDWQRFWLKGERRTETVLPQETAAALASQYERWDQMADMKRAVDRMPACVRAATSE